MSLIVGRPNTPHITLPASLLQGSYILDIDGPELISVRRSMPQVFVNGKPQPLKAAEASIQLALMGVPPFEPTTFALTRFRLSDGRQIFVCTELAENKGMSVTNAWPWLAEKILRLAKDAKPETSVFVEHYFEGSYRTPRREETFDLVRIEWEGSFAVGQSWERP